MNPGDERTGKQTAPVLHPPLNARLLVRVAAYSKDNVHPNR